MFKKNLIPVSHFFKVFLSTFATCFILQSPIAAEEETPKSIAIELPADFRSIVPREADLNQSTPDACLESYIQGALDARYPDSGVKVFVRNGGVFLSHLSSDSEQIDHISAYVAALTKKSVSNETRAQKVQNEKKEDLKKEPFLVLKSEGIWLPQSTILYPTEVANPRQIFFSIGARFHDILVHKGKQWETAISFGDQLPVYRWTNICHGDLQLELEAGVFGIFNMRYKSYPLVNADYYVGIPLTYAKDKWSFRLRGYHISSHIGDEWLLDHKHIKRKNKSFEAIDFSAAYNVTPKVRVYGTVGTIAFSDAQMKLSPWYIQYGAEWRGATSNFTQLFGQPFAAIFIQNAQDTHFKMDATCAVGYEWGKVQGIGRKVRLFLEYHYGFSPDGQFSRLRSKYVSLRLSYGF